MRRWPRRRAPRRHRNRPVLECHGAVGPAGRNRRSSGNFYRDFTNSRLFLQNPAGSCIRSRIRANPSGLVYVRCCSSSPTKVFIPFATTFWSPAQFRPVARARLEPGTSTCGAMAEPAPTRGGRRRTGISHTASTMWPVAGVAPTARPRAAPGSVGAAGAAPAPAPAPATAGTFAYMVGFGGGPGTARADSVGRGGAKAPAATIPAAGRGGAQPGGRGRGGAGGRQCANTPTNSWT